MAAKSDLYQVLLSDIKALAKPNLDPFFAKYAGTPHVTYGLSNPQKLKLIKALKKEHPELEFEAWLQLLDELYHGKSYEEKTVTGYLLAAYPEYLQVLPLTQLDKWLGELAGWAEVDMTCQSAINDSVMLNNWNGWEKFLRALATDQNINKRRASLVLLCKPLRQSSQPKLSKLALQLVEQLKTEKAILITKAISWVLRSMVSNYREELKDYLDKNAATLPAIAVRETRRKLTTGRK